MPLRIRLTCAIAVAALTSGATPARPQSATGTIVGIVTAAATGAPLPNPDVLVVGTGQATFGGADGKFVIRGVAVGPLQVRIRRVGFIPATVSVTVRAGAADTVRAALEPLVIRLAQVRVSDNSCGRPRAGDSVVATLYAQVQQNAERARLFAKTYPFAMSLERIYVTEHPEARNGRLRDTLRVDTAIVTGDHDWRYRPGKLIEPVENAVGGATERMIVLQLADFADDAFVGAHCYRYAGVERMDNRTMIRVNFEPARGVPDPDVSGALYLDSETFEIRHSVLEVERPGVGAPPVTMHTRVDTWFRSLAPGHVVIDHVAQRTTVEKVDTARDRRQFNSTAEFHRLLDVHFTTDRQP